MAVITFDAVSTELTNARASPPVFADANTSGARVRIKKFSYTATGAVTSGSQIALLEFPSNAMVIGGAITGISFSNSATASIGWTATATPVDNTFNVFVSAVTVATRFSPAMVQFTEKSTLFLTTGVGALAANNVVSGYVLYVEGT